MKAKKISSNSFGTNVWANCLRNAEFWLYAYWLLDIPALLSGIWHVGNSLFNIFSTVHSSLVTQFILVGLAILYVICYWEIDNPNFQCLIWCKTEWTCLCIFSGKHALVHNTGKWYYCSITSLGTTDVYLLLVDHQRYCCFMCTIQVIAAFSLLFLHLRIGCLWKVIKAICLLFTSWGYMQIFSGIKTWSS